MQAYDEYINPILEKAEKAYNKSLLLRLTLAAIGVSRGGWLAWVTQRANRKWEG